MLGFKQGKKLSGSVAYNISYLLSKLGSRPFLEFRVQVLYITSFQQLSTTSEFIIQQHLVNSLMACQIF